MGMRRLPFWNIAGTYFIAEKWKNESIRDGDEQAEFLRCA
jgi:hypothetical protein